MAKPKLSTNSNRVESRKNTSNNNSTNVKNRNQKVFQRKVEKIETSQSKSNDIHDDALPDDPGEAKVKEEDAILETE